MYQRAFLDGWLSDEDENLIGGEPESPELLFENGWGESAWQDVADAADTLTPPGSETHHELLTREQEGEIAMALGVAFSRLQAGLGHTRETLDALVGRLPKLWRSVAVYRGLARRPSVLTRMAGVASVPPQAFRCSLPQKR